MKKKIVSNNKLTANKKCKTEKQESEHDKLLLHMMSGYFANKQEQLDHALHEILKLSGSEFGYICFYDEESEEFVLNSWTKGVIEECSVEDKSEIYQLKETGVWGEVIRQENNYKND